MYVCVVCVYIHMHKCIYKHTIQTYIVNIDVNARIGD